MSIPFTLTMLSLIVGCIVVEYTKPCSVLLGESQFVDSTFIVPFNVAEKSVISEAFKVTIVG